ncbi:2-dehydro-3-deoxyphosphogluconate aldolase [Streptomonospora alba]|uniref:2-dehydro-3-deoxyphosphogluconate aldolase n=1 Tax=Streptomonospora alba TaxID=183763 RepID=A0A0C2FK53_9ACTN|nr:bifunctional 4-hydroxy-2-oxoglutarate aldolase/2-dehydro-3-deoxy-phosphogluconate aldolase [Streptomonospora alba]KIH99734.1 2-dehydro-3-deoxyphosphogluconate aldolase [Streptomonospora alba]
MGEDTLFDELFSRSRIMAILRGMSRERTLRFAERAWDLGVDAVEVPVQTPEAVEALRAVAEAGAARGQHVGAGTVITPEHVDAAREAGAVFTVAPGFDAEVSAASRAAGMAHLPGVATATDIQQALRNGHRWVKAFPAAPLGTEWMTAMRGPFPDLRIVATGGVDAGNAAEYLAAGADVVAVGSAIADADRFAALVEAAGSGGAR